jgi:uncharacterized protein (TIGR02145 family)
MNKFLVVLVIMLLCKSLHSQEKGTFTDNRDGFTYTWVKIGSQTWMVENLKTIYYANGDTIPDGTGAGDITGETNPKYWFAYNNDLNHISTYGRLYTGYTVTDSRNVCPEGWHVPTNAEWTTLETYLGGSGIAGGKIKEAGTNSWNSPNTGATNESGFSALPGGARQPDGTFGFMGEVGSWWSSTEREVAKVWGRGLYYAGEGIYGSEEPKECGYSVRCLKD